MLHLEDAKSSKNLEGVPFVNVVGYGACPVPSGVRDAGPARTRVFSGICLRSR